MITETNLRLLTEGWQDLTNKQYDDASKGIGRIDRNGDYYPKKEVTAKILKKQKASNRTKSEADLALGAFKNVEATVIKSANSVYAGKNNVAKIEADPDANKSYSSKTKTAYAGKGFSVDPMYLYVLVIDTNGNKAHIRVDSRPSPNKQVYVEKEDNCSISDEYLNKIGNSIVNFMHRKIRTRYENSKRYEDEIREKIAKHHRNSSYPEGYTKGADYELRRRKYLGEDVRKEVMLTEGSHHSKYPPAVNYKYVNNYLIKARKALKEGKIEEADKLAWRACSLMHEDEMQGPGVSADKNAYNIFHKQLGNIQNAIIAARKANKESN